MAKPLLQIFWFLSLIALNYALEHEGDFHDGRQKYDLERVWRSTAEHLQDSRRLKDFDLLKHLQFKGIDDSFEFKPSDLLNMTSPNSWECLADIYHISQNIKSQWALELIDSFGKPESGLLQGNFKWIGDYNECMGVRAHNANSSLYGNFRGKYCSLKWSLTLQNVTLPFPFMTGMCVPDSCSEADLEEAAPIILQIAGVYPILNETGIVLNTTSLQCKPTERQLNAAAKTVIFLLSVFVALIVLGSSITAVKYFKKVLENSKAAYLPDNISEGQIIGDENNASQKNVKRDDKELLLNDASDNNGRFQKVEAILQCFCVFTNGAKLLNTDTSEGEMLCIHGIRFLSMSWVILGHTYYFGIEEMNNMVQLQTLITNFPFQILLQAFFSVDSFFVLSGFLLAYLSMKQFSKSGSNISWAYFYVHRYLRLTPIYMILLGFSATLYNYIGSGPYWQDRDVDPSCVKDWWWNLLYINNFEPNGGMCMGWTWYLANDMQFFVISPIFLITLWRWPKIGYSLLGIFMGANCLANFCITYHFDLPAGLVTLINNGPITDVTKFQTQFSNFFLKLYIKPYTRIGPYLVGLLAGYILFKKRGVNDSKHSLVFLLTGWITATTLTLAVVYGLYHRHQSLVEISIYNAFNRTCFALGLCWVIYVCLMGHGGPVNRILSFRLFIPLSRLTYSAYLIHPMVITWYFASLKTNLEFTHATIVTVYLGFMIVTYALALPVALMLESPIVSLEKLVRKAFVKEQKKEVVN